MPRPHPVLLMAWQLDLGGSERQLTEMARKLDRTCFQPHVVCFRPGGKRAAELAAEGIPVYSLDMYSLQPPGSLAAAWRLGRYLREHHIELLHAFDAPACIFAVPVARALSRAVVLSSQRAHRELVSARFRHLLRITDRLVDGVVVNCRFLQRYLTEEENVPASLIHLCYNGIDTDVFQSRLRSTPAASPDDDLRIGVVCALRPEKQLHLLLDAFAQVHRTRKKLELLIVGDGSCLPELQARASNLGIAFACTFQPATADVRPWLYGMDIFVLPSRSEALSNALMEAMACGCCAVASRVGGNPELIHHEKTGLLFQSGNAAELAAMLHRLIHQESLRKKLAAAGQCFIHQGFSLKEAARSMGEIYLGYLND